MPSDPLSEVLDLVNARCLMSGGLIAGGAWARRFPRPDVIKFMAVAEGTCWLIMEELEAPLRLYMRVPLSTGLWHSLLRS